MEMGCDIDKKLSITEENEKLHLMYIEEHI